MYRTGKRVGIIGCGAIGRAVAAAFRLRKIPGRLVAICDVQPAAAEGLARMLRPRPRITSLAGVIRAADVVIECAQAAAVPEVVRRSLKGHRDMVIMSVSGLLAAPRLLAAARRCSRSQLVVPSGALGGLDALRAAAGAGLTRVTLETRKPPRALEGAPYLVARKQTLTGLKSPKVVYAGSAAGAARGFPANVNVAATTLLAGGGRHATRVRIIADPALKFNVHELVLVGKFGRAVFRVENRPSPDNPRTSYLAALSAIAALNRLLAGVQIGG